jgi:hypothetical protein
MTCHCRPTEQPVFPQVYDTSPRDGGIAHLASVVVYFVAGGPAEVKTLGARPEQIQILAPSGVPRAGSSGR